MYERFWSFSSTFIDIHIEVFPKVDEDTFNSIGGICFSLIILKDIKGIYRMEAVPFFFMPNI